ncbi:MAG: DUF4421 domain-containing protein [Cyclobacteriaceae bacterium]|nr:DUF4421 domain-containing protein [Cyclobacteriaceae bacterium]MDH4296733.1 DUF4421 domain-containing protein [Cyclobacteriaceae bacterium]MDH5250187.1 DUF4421 domain-containing protein [Cyclobacteriaceae bacterium]
MRTICILKAVGLLLPFIASAQLADTVSSEIKANQYIEKMDKYLTFRLSMNDDIQAFRVNSYIDYSIQPNDKTLLKISTSYRWFSFSISAAPEFLPGNGDNDLKGESKATSFSLGLNFSHWIQGITYSRFKGYYLENTGDFDPGWIKDVDPYVQFPDFVYQRFHGQTAYKFNEMFSFNALSVQTERQLRSAGTFMPVLSYEYYITDDQAELTGQNKTQKENNFELLLSLGYFHTFVIHRNFYASAGVMPGAGVIFGKLLTRQPGGNIESNQSYFLLWAQGAGALGFNSERFFAGTQLIFSRGFYEEGASTTIRNDRFTYHLFLGYRFNAPKSLTKAADKADEKRSKIFK